MAEQALAAAIVAFAFLYFRHLYTIRPDAVYRKALVQLNTNPGILEVNARTNILLTGASTALKMDTAKASQRNCVAAEAPR